MRKYLLLIKEKHAFIIDAYLILNMESIFHNIIESFSLVAVNRYLVFNIKLFKAFTIFFFLCVCLTLLCDPENEFVLRISLTLNIS